MPSLYLNPKVQFDSIAAILKIRYDVITHNSAADGPITMKYGRRVYDMPMQHTRQNQNRKYDSNMAALRFLKPEVVLSQPSIELFHRNLACK